MSVLLKNISSENLPADPLHLAFFDIDGTIMSAADRISDATTSEIRHLRQDGVAVALASGRPYFGAREVIRQLEITHPCIFFSGALVVDPVTEKPLQVTPIELPQLKETLSAIRNSGLYCEAYTSSDYYVETESVFADIHQTYLKKRPILSNLDEVVAREPILKLVLMLEKKDETRLLALTPQLGDLALGVGYGAAHPNIIFANLTSPLASRERCFEFVTKHLGVSARNVIAFGDAEADVPFLKLSGFGIAMANAPEHVRTSARYVTESVESDGVALALRMFRARRLAGS